VILIAGSDKRLRLLFAEDEVFMTRSRNVTPKTIEQNLTVRSSKSEADVILTIKDCARGTVVDGHKASSGLATAELLVCIDGYYVVNNDFHMGIGLQTVD